MTTSEPPAVVVGACKLKITAEEMVSLSDTSPAVDCATPHTLETYALGTLDADVAALGPERPAPEILTAHDGDVCPWTVRDYLSADALDSQWGLSIFAKYPTRAQWADGDRTVTCDLVVSAAPGVVPTRNTSLAGALGRQDSARIRLCTDGEERLTCDQPHTAERAGDVPVTDPATEQQACASNARAYTRVHGRSATSTAAATAGVGAGAAPWPTTVVHRDGVAECWISTLDGSGTGTVRGGLAAR